MRRPSRGRPVVRARGYVRPRRGVQLVAQLEEQALAWAEHRRPGILGAEVARLVGRQTDPRPEERHVHPPLVLGAAPEAGAVDDQLALAEGQRAAVEETAGHQS